MRVPSESVCVWRVCVECVWSAVRFQFRGSSACKMDQRSAICDLRASLTPQQRIMPCCLGKSLINRLQLLSLLHTHVAHTSAQQDTLAYRPCPFLGLTEVIAISRDKQLARAVRREPHLTAVGHLEASRGEREERERAAENPFGERKEVPSIC